MGTMWRIWRLLLFPRKFQAKDVIENEGNTKFNVTKMEVVEEVDMPYEMPYEDIGYLTGGTASATDEFRIESANE